jgi:hypothetical protein
MISDNLKISVGEFGAMGIPIIEVVKAVIIYG